MYFYEILSKVSVLMIIMQQICVDIEDYWTKQKAKPLVSWLLVFYRLSLLTIGSGSGGVGRGLFQVSTYLNV
jgi:hypothetical protein